MRFLSESDHSHINTKLVSKLLFAAAITLTLQDSQDPYRNRVIDGNNCTAHAYIDQGLLLMEDSRYPKYRFPKMTGGPGKPDAYLHSFAPGETNDGYYYPIVPLYLDEGVEIPKDVLPPFDEATIYGNRVGCRDTRDMDYIRVSKIVSGN